MLNVRASAQLNAPCSRSSGDNVPSGCESGLGASVSDSASLGFLLWSAHNPELSKLQARNELDTRTANWGPEIILYTGRKKVYAESINRTGAACRIRLKGRSEHRRDL